MANVTDPLAAVVHGSDPQNLMEYITRQKIYDSRYWKEECFGLTAVNVLEKATKLTCLGASFGGNRQPTKFLCLVLKLLQIQPEEALVDEFIANEDFKYVRALGAFFQRLSGRPADIYRALEPLYTDYRKLRYRDINEWKLVYMDEFIHSLLKDERVCGIALPRLPQRRTLEQEGYLDEPRQSALSQVLQDQTPEQYLYEKVRQGSVAAKSLWELRENRKKEKELKSKTVRSSSKEQAMTTPREHGHNIEDRSRHLRHEHDNQRRFDRDDSFQGDRRRQGNTHSDDRESRGEHRNGDDRGYGHDRPRDNDQRHIGEDKSHKRERGYRVESSGKKSKKEESYGTLFKSSRSSTNTHTSKPTVEPSTAALEEGSEDYWNEQRSKLGLKPLK